MYHTRSIPAVLVAGAATLLCLQLSLTAAAFAGADPAFTFYGYQEIVADPSPAIAGENTHITVTVRNPGDLPATNVMVKLSFNDWGVTFQGWQEIDVVSISSIPAGGTGEAKFEYVFENRAHTCLEALIVSADEDTNPGNDRGQINMEVVNAGDSFEYYVPIVNNGEDDLLVRIEGGCRGGQDPAGEVAGWCRPIDHDEPVLVPAGGQIVVPVQVEFAPGTLRGTQVDFFVDAYDVLDPGNVNARNHVVVRAVYNTPRGLIEDCLATLAALPDLPSPGKDKSKGKSNKLDEIASHIDKALADEAWVDDSRLDLHPRAVNLVYGQTAVAVQQLSALTESKHLPIESKIALNHCARQLTDATRILLQTVLRDVSGDPDAEVLLKEGDQLRLAGEGKKAVRNYHRGHVTVLK